MIGEKLLKKPDNCTQISEIFKTVGFDESRLEGSIMFISYIAEKFVDLNNEVYEKLNPPSCKTCKHDFDESVYMQLNGWPEICKTCKLGIGYKKNTLNFERK